MTRQETFLAPAGPIIAQVDVAVIGGGAAGLSAALVLGRSRRTVAVVDAGHPRNAPADGVHGFLTRDGMSPADLMAAGRAEVQHYGGLLIDGEAVSARRDGTDGFQVGVAGGGVVRARRLVVTTGLVDELPELARVGERWGRDVLHCPYCHGWEVRDQPVGVLGTGAGVVHQTLLFRQLTADLVLFTHTAPELSAEQLEQLTARGVRVVDGTVSGLDVEDDRMVGVRMTDGRVVPRSALVIGTRLVARSAVLAGLGLGPTPHPSGFGEHIAADATGLTEVAGVWVAGNVTDLLAQVVTAAAQGVTVAAAVNADLITQDTRHAVAAYRESSSAASGVDVGEAVVDVRATT